jgi:hypothetical protein
MPNLSLKKLVLAVGLAVAGALLSTASASAQAGGVGSDTTTSVGTRDWSADMSGSYYGDMYSNGKDFFRVSVRGEKEESGGGGGGAVVPVGPPPCVSSGPRFTQDIPLPGLTIKSWPTTRGIVGTPTYFWVESSSFDGTHIEYDVPAEYTRRAPTFDAYGNQTGCAVSVVPITVRIAFWPVDYRWDFGDKSEDVTRFTCDEARRNRPGPADCSTGLGKPELGGIPHVYQISSVREGEDGFTVEFEVDFIFGIYIAGGFDEFPQTIEQIQRRELPVEQIQAILVE